jgi:thioredoxin reductase
MQPYDLIVIGSGPGGQRAAIQDAKAGKRVAVVEKQTAIGGVCIAFSVDSGGNSGPDSTAVSGLWRAIVCYRGQPHGMRPANMTA